VRARSHLPEIQAHSWYKTAISDVWRSNLLRIFHGYNFCSKAFKVYNHMPFLYIYFDVQKRRLLHIHASTHNSHSSCRFSTASTPSQYTGTGSQPIGSRRTAGCVRVFSKSLVRKRIFDVPLDKCATAAREKGNVTVWGVMGSVYRARVHTLLCLANKKQAMHVCCRSTTSENGLALCPIYGLVRKVIFFSLQTGRSYC
jgi:hypothetical protein